MDKKRLVGILAIFPCLVFAQDKTPAFPVYQVFSQDLAQIEQGKYGKFEVNVCKPYKNDDLNVFCINTEKPSPTGSKKFIIGYQYQENYAYFSNKDYPFYESNLTYHGKEEQWKRFPYLPNKVSGFQYQDNTCDGAFAQYNPKGDENYNLVIMNGEKVIEIQPMAGASYTLLGVAPQPQLRAALVLYKKEDFEGLQYYLMKVPCQNNINNKYVRMK